MSYQINKPNSINPGILEYKIIIVWWYDYEILNNFQPNKPTLLPVPFADIPTSVYGEFLRQQVEDRLKFYETGEAPKKNVDVMHEAVLEVGLRGLHLLSKMLI